jgi:hypothetical protein
MNCFRAICLHNFIYVKICFGGFRVADARQRSSFLVGGKRFLGRFFCYFVSLPDRVKTRLNLSDGLETNRIRTSKRLRLWCIAS